MMIGDGPERSRAEWLAVEKGIHDKVDFLGKQDRIYEKLPMADVMLMPSELESFGLAALEAMACEVVPIATNAGGVPEVIEHGKTGFLAAVGDVETMANYAIEVAFRPGEAGRDGRFGARQGAGAVLRQQDHSRCTRITTATCWSAPRRSRRRPSRPCLRPTAPAAPVAPASRDRAGFRW